MMTMLLRLILLTSLLAAAGCSASWPGHDTSVEKRELTPSLASRAPTISPPEKPVPAETVFSWADITEADLGIGYLAPKTKTEKKGRWMRQLELPIFSSPSGEQTGWLINGWVKKDRAEDPEPLTALGMVEAAPDLFAFIVLSKSRDGWLRFRYDRPKPEDDGTAWVHVNHLAIGPAPLHLQLWGEPLLTPEYSPLFFRNKHASHALREAPALNGRLIGWIGRSHDLEPLEIRGDWMKVQVTQPSVRCRADRLPGTRTQEGWTRWRHPENGLWVWYHTEPCP